MYAEFGANLNFLRWISVLLIFRSSILKLPPPIHTCKIDIYLHKAIQDDRLDVAHAILKAESWMQ